MHLHFITGREESQVVHFNPVNKTWGPDNSSLQRHVNIAIAFNLIRFFDTAKDGYYSFCHLLFKELTYVCKILYGKIWCRDPI